jgi:putative membrane protein
MIVRKQPTSLALFFVMQGSIVPKVAGKIIVVTLLSLLVLIADHWILPLPHIHVTAMGVFGVALSLFLGFRNNVAFDRWWEARKLWGTVVADVRNLGRDVLIFAKDKDDQKSILSMAMASLHLHRGNLRGDNVAEDVEKWIPKTDADRLAKMRNPATGALYSTAEIIRYSADNGKISEFGQLSLQKTLSSISLQEAGCERIATTPIPYVYSLLVRRTTYLYCWLLPFALVEATGPFTPVLTAIVAYVFFGLQAVTNELESPFCNEENGLPLKAMCRTMEISVCEALDLPTPDPVAAQNHILI